MEVLNQADSFLYSASCSLPVVSGDWMCGRLIWENLLTAMRGSVYLARKSFRPEFLTNDS